eukprot:gene20012-15241_t
MVLASVDGALVRTNDDVADALDGLHVVDGRAVVRFHFRPAECKMKI